MAQKNRDVAEFAGFGLDLLGRSMSIYAPSRAQRPGAFHIPKQGDLASSRPCPFCPGNESSTPPEWISSREAPNSPWRARIVPNRFSAVPPFQSDESDSGQLYGVHDVVIESAIHDPFVVFGPKHHGFHLWEMILSRLNTLNGDPRIAHLAWFRNQGSPAGASLEHPHSQILGINRIPPGIDSRNRVARRFFRENQISWIRELRGHAIRSKKRVILRENGITVFCPLVSRTCYEMLLVPDSPSNSRIPQVGEAAAISNSLRRVISSLQKVTHTEVPFNLTLQISPPRTGPWFTWHIEVLPRMSQLAGWEWASGSYINPIPPEIAAKRLKDALGD